MLFKLLRQIKRKHFTNFIFHHETIRALNEKKTTVSCRASVFFWFHLLALKNFLLLKIENKVITDNLGYVD